MPDTQLPDPQAAVNAALGNPPATTPMEPVQPMTTPAPMPPTETVPTELVNPADPTKPVEALVASAPEPVTLPQPEPLPMPQPAPSTGVPMGDDTPLAFAAAQAMAAPSSPAPTPVTEGTSSYLPPTPPIPPAPAVPPEPKKKKGGKGKVVGVLAGVLLLVVGVVGGLWGYERLSGKPGLIAAITMPCGEADAGQCVPKSWTCKSSGKGTCSGGGKCGINCSEPGGGGGGGGDPEICTPGAQNNCTPIDGCPAKSTCNSSGTAWQPCAKVDPNCKPCASVICDQGATCKNGLCEFPCAAGYELDASGQCVLLNAGGPVSCGSIKTAAQCTAAGGEPVTEPGTGSKCDANGHWCSVIRDECKINGKWCLMGTSDKCSGGVDERCVPATPTPTPKPSPIPSPTPSPSPSPSPSPVMACTGLTKAPTTAPKIGDKITFTCTGTSTYTGGAAALKYKYRYNINDGAWTNLTTKTNGKSELTIAACGSYEVQCRACVTSGATEICDPTWTGATQ